MVRTPEEIAALCLGWLFGATSCMIFYEAFVRPCWEDECRKREKEMMSAQLTDAHREALLIEGGVPQGWIDEAKALGFTLAQLLAMLVQYGMPFLQFLATLFGWALPPVPVPPIPTPIPGPLKAKLKP